MKKILSFILALTLCIGLLPTFAFAATAEEFTVDFTQSNFAGWFNNGSSAARKSDGSGVQWTASGDKAVSTAVTNNSRVRFDTNYLQLGLSANDVSGGYDTMVVSFDVPVSGVYDIDSELGYTTSGGNLGVYIDGNAVNSQIEMYIPTMTNKDFDFKSTSIGGDVYLSKGTHKLALKVGTHQSVSETYYAAVKSITFTPVEGTFAIDFTDVDTSTLYNNQYLKENGTANGNGWSAVSDKDSSTIYQGNTEVRFFFNNYVQFAFWAGIAAGGYDFVVKINVPDSGVYNINSELGYTTAGTNLGVYIDGKVVNPSIELYVNQMESTAYDFKDTFVGENVYLSKGEHILTFKFMKNSNVSATPYFAIKNLKFTPVEGVFVVDFAQSNYTGWFNNGSSAARKSDGGGVAWTAIGDKTVSTAITNNSRVQFATAGFLQIGVNNTSDIPNECDTMVITFTVPESGIYDVVSELGYTKMAGDLGVYIDGNAINSKIVTYISEMQNTDWDWGNTSVADGIYLSEGAHELALKVAVNSSADTSTYYAGVKNLTFTKSTATDVITPDAESMKVSFAETTNVAGFGGITVSSVARGKSVELTAHKQEISGYKFIGWKRGADTSDKNAWVDITGDEYEVWTNTYLTAIYEPVVAPTGKVVEFWDQNGAYMGQKNEASYKEVLNFPLTLTGYGAFKGWFIDKDVKLTEDTVLSAGTTNAVAQYEDGEISGVTLNGNDVVEANVYNKAIPFSKSIEGFTCWKRDGKIISYDATYTYNVWDATAITEADDVIADKVPVAILEYNDDYKAYMLEYDDGDYEIVEAGIIFDGDSVDSCAKKYTSQRKVSHNQFTAPKGDYSSAKGYIIWKDAFGAFHIDYYSVQ